jgi:hypothetical protein
LKDLDHENPLIAKPQNLVPIVAILPFILGACCSILASDASPHTAFLKNPLAIFCICLCLTGFFLILIPRLFKWDWRAKYFGASLVHLGSVGLLGVVPWLCIVLYSILPLWTRVLILFGYGIPIIWWCNRSVQFYRSIYCSRELRNILYVEENDVVYYLQRSDKWLTEKKFNFSQCPSNRSFILSAGAAFLLVPLMEPATKIIGLPFPHLFLAIIGFPLVLMCAALTTRGCLVFYYYPQKIKAETGKDVYVDMVRKPPTLAFAKKHSGHPTSLIH